MRRGFGASGAAGIPACATCPRIRLPVPASLAVVRCASCRPAVAGLRANTGEWDNSMTQLLQFIRNICRAGLSPGPSCLSHRADA